MVKKKKKHSKLVLLLDCIKELRSGSKWLGGTKNILQSISLVNQTYILYDLYHTIYIVCKRQYYEKVFTAQFSFSMPAFALEATENDQLLQTTIQS